MQRIQVFVLRIAYFLVSFLALLSTVFVSPVGAQNTLRHSDSTSEITIQIPALARPTLAEIQKRFPWIRSIQQDASPTEPVTLKLAGFVSAKEGSIGEEAYMQRLAMTGMAVLGYQQALWLADHQDEFPALLAFDGKIYVDFPGLVMVDGVGGHDFPFLVRHHGRWRLECGWSGRGADWRGRVAFGR